MKSNIPLQVNPKTWLFNSSLSPHLNSFNSYLQSGRYTINTTKRYVACIAHFAYWMDQNKLKVQALDERAVEEFLTDHLPLCNCPSPVVRFQRDLQAALMHLLYALRQQGIIPKPLERSDYITEELCRYDHYMLNTRGLSIGTRRGRLHVIRRLLLYKFADRAIVFDQFDPSDIRQFISEQLQLGGSISHATGLVSALRTYLRYRSICGDSVHRLLGAIASPANWGLASLPRSLKLDEVDRLLESFSPTLPSQKRGLAIVHCFLDLGLRCGEVCQLQLDDIDWHAGIVTLRRTKARRQDSLPLPVATGQALVDYICNERPKTTNRAVFVRCLAPHDLPMSVHGIHRVIRDAYQRIGLNHGRTHAMRHTLACRLIDHGSSLKEVADVLRHRSLNTSLIYAKLDNRNLIGVALPWPGGAA
jgi:site-specific recombinase XerD